MQVNLKMLNNIIEEEDDCFVFFYDQVDPDAHAILSELEGMSIEELSMDFFHISVGKMVLTKCHLT